MPGVGAYVPLNYLLQRANTVEMPDTQKQVGPTAVTAHERMLSLALGLESPICNPTLWHTNTKLTASEPSLLRFFVTMLPAAENTRTELPDEAGMAR